MSIRVRFAPSPTGALHIGGIRTALFNYLLAKKHGGTFILRIEDTDQGRYVEGAEQYIIEALKWCGIAPTEGVGFGEGQYAPYRQSDRFKQGVYRKYADELIQKGLAYYAFDTSEQLEAMRETLKAEGGKNQSYSHATRLRDDLNLQNSLRLSAAETAKRIETGENYVIRLKIDGNQLVTLSDIIRGEVTFNTNELDDKVLLKADGMPTYHLANIVDDYEMKISHVIRGEEWLPSAGHHVLIYRAFGWESAMPQFAHLPLILKPDGKGKLSKRDGAKFGFPVFPLEWNDSDPAKSFDGFRSIGFDPKAVVNFLSMLGWNPGTEQEIFSLDELANLFSLEKINKSGARFDYDKAKWFNQQYIPEDGRTPSGSKLNRRVELAALRAAGAIHISIVCINKAAFLAAKNSIFTRARTETAPPHLGINRQRHQPAKQQRHVAKNKCGGGHDQGVVAAALVLASVCHSKISNPAVSLSSGSRSAANFVS